jgi:hypothetical protein
MDMTKYHNNPTKDEGVALVILERERRDTRGHSPGRRLFLLG